MIARPGLLRRHAQRLAALVAIFALYGLARLPAPSDAERQSLAERFSFERRTLPQVDGQRAKTIREVHPALAAHAAWISAVGAAVALSDLDGDGLPNDVAWVDTRTDQVIVTPLPAGRAAGGETASRYAPFALRLPADLDGPAIAPMGCVGADLNEDSLLDVLVYYWGRTPVAFLSTPGPQPRPLSGEVYRAVEIVPGGERWNTNAATTADIDGDGHLDVVIGNYFQDGARILDPHADSTEEMQDSMSRALNAGWNRILLWRGASSGPAPHVQFEDVAGVFDEDIARGWTLAIGAADLDGDLLPELYLANDFGSDRLLHNRSTPGSPRFALLRGRKTLGVPNSKVLGRDSFKGMGCDFGDVNGDGRLDIYVSNIAEEFALQESHFLWQSDGPVELMAEGIAPYVDASEALGLSRSGWGWESRLADFDNDGVLEAIQATGFLKGEIDRWPELHELAMGNDSLLHRSASWPQYLSGDDLSGHQHNPFFVRAADGRYYDVAPQIGLGDEFVTRGIATADVDGDGDLDFAIANQWEDSFVYVNEGGSRSGFLGLNLIRSDEATKPTGLVGMAAKRPLVESSDEAGVRVRAGHPGPGMRGRPAVGAVVEVRLPDGRVLVGHVDGGNGHSGKRSHQVHFGLGQVTEGAKVQVQVRWRDGSAEPRRAELELAPGWHTVMLGEGQP